MIIETSQRQKMLSGQFWLKMSVLGVLPWWWIGQLLVAIKAEEELRALREGKISIPPPPHLLTLDQMNNS